MAKNKDTIFWVIGVVILVLALSQLPMAQWFAIVTTTTCVENTNSYWDMDGNVLDSFNVNNGIDSNISFISGKLGQAAEFNTENYISFPLIVSDYTVMWIKNYSAGDTDYYFLANLNGTNYVNVALDNTKQIIPLGPTFGLGFNGSVDMIATFDNLSVETMADIYNYGNAIEICYSTSYEENVSCMDYATEQVAPFDEGCLDYSGDFFPNCEYEWINVTQYTIEDNECNMSFYCQDSCSDNTTNCYTTNQSCIIDLAYDCYIIESNKCVHKTDYSNCTGTDYYSNSTACQSNLTVAAPTTTTPTTTTPTTTTKDETFSEKFTKPVFTIADFEVTIVHLLILLAVVIAGLYFLGTFKRNK